MLKVIDRAEGISLAMKGQLLKKISMEGINNAVGIEINVRAVVNILEVSNICRQRSGV